MPVSDQMRLTSLTIAPGAQWNVPCQIAAFPPHWLGPLTDAYHRRPGIKDDWSLPTRGLVELLIGLDPAVMHVSWNLHSDQFIIALPGADTTVLAAAIASWATTEVTPDGSDVDWWELFQADQLHFHDETIDLLDYGTYPNGTAAPATAMFDLLPSFLAQHVVAAGLPLLGRPRTWIAGPPRADGRRSAVLWPPDKLENPTTGDALVTAKITFHVETVPNHPVPHIHADLSISRFPLMPVSYVPARGDGPPGATLWLHAPEGFLREYEPHTLLAAPTQHVWSREHHARQWQWKPGLATALSRLTHLPFPAPDKVFAHPSAASDEGKIRAYVLYSEGSKSLAGDIDDPDDPEALAAGKPKARSLLHAANTGFVPADHIEAHEQLAAALAPHSIGMLDPCRRAGKRTYRKVRPAENPGQGYTLELWTQSALTREAILAALEHHHQLRPAADPRDPAVIHFTGDLDLTVILKDAGALGAGLDRTPDDTRPESTRLGAHANHVAGQLGPSPDPRTAILELEDGQHFHRAGQIDPKPALKKAFARTDRRLQCLRPARLFTPPASPPKNTKKNPPAPYPGTRFTTSSIYRASAAINDALRQLGRVGSYETPDHLPDLEHVGIWLHHSGSACIPIVIRLGPDGTATAHLASADGTASTALPYRDLAPALASGKGRIRGDKKQKDHVARFLTNALGVGDQVSQDTHDRVVFVRSASFRNWGWDWLQDKHLQPDQLTLPGVSLSDDDTEAPQPLLPPDCPGLRIIRVRDRSSTDEVARGFAADYRTTSVRISGLFAFSARLFYSVNPRSDQMQTPLGATKLDPDILRNYTTQAANPNPLEIYPVFLQPADNPADYAILASRLRRTYLHTEQATRFPAPMHLCDLAAEYL
jgi:RNaseH domain of pPIWI_RE/pPIWI_RE module N-terminal domain/MID domain of pPIWI_RE